MIEIKNVIKSIKKHIKRDAEYYYIPEFLFRESNKLSPEGRVLYTILLHVLAADENAKYIYFTRTDARKLLRCGNTKSSNTFKELQENNFITEIQQGLGKPNKIYLNDIEIEHTDTLEVKNE